MNSAAIWTANAVLPPNANWNDVSSTPATPAPAPDTLATAGADNQSPPPRQKALFSQGRGPFFNDKGILNRYPLQPPTG